MSNLRAIDVAGYFLAQLDEEHCGDTLSNLKLQKLLYYAQGASLVILNEPLFPDRVMAWNHGPVVPSVYHEYKKYKAGAIPPPTNLNLKKFSKKTRSLLDEVYKVFGQFSAWKLRNMTHNEPPWKNAIAIKGGVISRVSMRKHFQTLLK